MVLFYLHWNEKELKERVAALKELQLTIKSHWSTDTVAKFGSELPDVFVISLERLPSHGKQYAEWIWEAKSRQHIPLIFVGGQTEKVKGIKEQFPNAIYCQPEQLTDNIKKLIKEKI